MTESNTGAFHYIINSNQRRKSAISGCCEFWTLPDWKNASEILTVNSPVTASKPTWMVCSKSEGRDISGRSFSFFLFAEEHQKRDQITTRPCRRNVTQKAARVQRYSLLSPPGKMERRRTFLFFSSGAIGSGLEAWFSDEESRELLFILKGGAGGFSSISTLSDIFSSTQKFLGERERGIKSFSLQVSACDTWTAGYFG